MSCDLSISYNIAGLAPDDAIQLARDKREIALFKMTSARMEFDDWDEVLRRLLAARAKRVFDKIRALEEGGKL